MSYTVFARKYRPQTFQDVLGQEHVVRTLRNAIAQNRLAQAYLFVGPRGTGKTSTSRIFAKALNCKNGPSIDFDPNDDVCREIAEGRSLDVEEIDGASNNGVEQVRSLIEKVGYSPARGRFRIFYIDEVHMLSVNAFNALLKVLEEPPSHVKFIFATTEAHKILPTILSRCQRFDLRRIPTNVIADHLLHIATLENVKLEPLAAHAIAKAADGGMRDAQSMLDQLVAFCGSHVQEEDVLHIFGLTSQETVVRLSSAILERNISQALGELHEQAEVGKDLTKLIADLIHHFRNVLVYQVDPSVAIRELPAEMRPVLEKQAGSVGNEKLLSIMDHLAEVEAGMRWAPNKRLNFEVGLIRSVQILGEASLSDVISTLGGVLAQGPGLSLPTAPLAAALPAVAVAPALPAVAAPTSSETPATVQSAAGSVASAPAPVPSAPAPMPVPAPEPEPEPEPDPDPPQQLEGEALWEGLTARVQAELPLLASWLLQATFREQTAKTLVIAFHPEDALAIDGLQRTQTKRDLEAMIRHLSGKTLTLEMKVDESLPTPVDESQPDEPASDKPATLTPEEEEAKQAAADDEKAAALEAEFRDDPLIREALIVFEGKFIRKP